MQADSTTWEFEAAWPAALWPHTNEQSGPGAFKPISGLDPNAVKTQIWIAISVYILVAILKKRLKLELSLYTTLQILSLTVFERHGLCTQASPLPWNWI